MKKKDFDLSFSVILGFSFACITLAFCTIPLGFIYGWKTRLQFLEPQYFLSYFLTLTIIWTVLVKKIIIPRYWTKSKEMK